MIRRPLRSLIQIACCLLALVLWPTLSAQDASKPTLIGRWDVTVTGPNGATFPSWFEVRKSGRKALVGSYVGQVGSARPIAEIFTEGETFHFSVPPQWEARSTNIEFKGRFEGEMLRGETTGTKGEILTWEARRAPALDHDAPAAWGEPINLISSKDIAGWKPQFANIPNGWQVIDGVLTNAQPGNNLITEQTFDDFQLVAEFRYPKGSNSGIYLRGRYEVQLEDQSGKAIDSHNIGGVYGFLTPSLNASLPAGEWQRLEATLVGRRVTIVLNGERVIDRQLIPGITGGALDSDEASPGPLMLQGDHGPIEFRKLVLTPAAKPARP